MSSVPTPPVHAACIRGTRCSVSTATAWVITASSARRDGMAPRRGTPHARNRPSSTRPGRTRRESCRGAARAGSERVAQRLRRPGWPQSCPEGDTELLAAARKFSAGHISPTGSRNSGAMRPEHAARTLLPADSVHPEDGWEQDQPDDGRGSPVQVALAR